MVGSDEYYYEADISGADKYASSVNVPAGMRFVGWYDNPEGIGDKYTFDGKTMPPNNLILYAKLVPEEYYIRLDYNGGETKGSESTFAWVNYGETIEEAEEVKRNYVVAAAGEMGTHDYIYWHYDEEADANGDGWWSYYEDANGNKVYNDPKDYSQRTATYVVAAGGKYKYDPGKYTFVGWYETDEDGNQISNVPFNFATQITRNTYLKAVFRKEGTFQVRYLSNMGTEGAEGYVAGDPNTAPPTDSYTYIDLSEAKVGHSIEPADNKYQFAGWRVKGTTGPVYQPGETFPINSDYAEEENGIQYITLEPVFIQKGDTRITYRVNTPTGATATGTALTGLTGNAQDELVLNSKVTLHDGEGFAVPGYGLIGWSDVPLAPNTVRKGDDGSFVGDLPEGAHLFTLGGTYGVSGEANTLYAVWASNIIRFTKTVAVADGSNLQQSDINHTIYIALTKNSKDNYVRTDPNDPYSNILVKEIRIVNGVPTPATVTFEGLDDGDYDVWELTNPYGNPPVRLGVSDVFPIQGSNPAANFAVQSITGSNNASVSGGNEANVNLTNTYANESETPITFEANKVWIDRKANVIADADMPENATATLSLYREINGQTETTPYASIVLDGEADAAGTPFGSTDPATGLRPYTQEDEPWHATFGNLPRTDESGRRIIYKVKETAATPDGYYPWKQKSQNNDAYGPNDYLTHSGGTIYNRKLTMSIRLDKHFDFQPNNGDEQAVTYDYFKTDKATQEKLSFTVTLPTEEVRTFKLSDFEPVQGVTTFSLTLEDIPYYTGLYAPAGYNGSTITFQESGEFELLEAYNYYLVNITPDNGTQWNIGSERPNTVTATKTVNMDVNANDPLYEIRIQNKYRRGSEGEFDKIKKTVIGLSAEDFAANEEMFKNLHFVIQRVDGYYAGKKATPAWNPETKRYEKLEWVQDINDATVIQPAFTYSAQSDTWVAQVNLQDFTNFPSGVYTLVELEGLEGGAAHIAGYTLEVLDNTVTVETHEEDVNWNESFKYTLSVTNKYTKNYGDVTFTKVDAEDNSIKLKGAEFTLYTDEACMTVAKDKDGEDAVETSTDDGTVTFANLIVGTYYMKETKAPEGYENNDKVYKVVLVMDEDGEITSTITLNGETVETPLTEIPNTPATVKVVLEKYTTGSNVKLAGARFDLYDKDPESATAENKINKSDIVSVDEDQDPGYVELGDLKIGTIYYLVETQAPDGYMLLSGPVRIHVERNAETKAIEVRYQNPGVDQTTAVSTTDGTVTIYTVKAYNNPGVELPATGGPGTAAYTAGGLGLIALALAALLLRRRREQ